jgi:hypothetical protein
MKPGDLVRLSEGDGSETFWLGNLDVLSGGIGIPDGSIGIVLRLHSPAFNEEESKLDVLVNGCVGWVYLTDCEVIDDPS